MFEVKSTVVLAIVCLAVITLAAGGYAQTEWQRYSGNPVLDKGEPGEWDSQGAGVVSVILYDGVYAGYFEGPVYVSGYLTKAGGGFKIDDPIDPENKYLVHSFVESPDMMNVYNGNIILDAKGEALVELPAYFETLNKDFRYQLTCIGGFAGVYIAEKIKDNHFKIAGGIPGLEVSWQVTGVRQDAWANAHRIVPEVDKKGDERGKYMHPKELGKPETMGIDYSEPGTHGGVK
jgi:hypothetical protein